MKIIPLSYGVQVTNLFLSKCSISHLKNIIELCIEEGLVLLNNQNISTERFDEINEVWGIHYPTNIWANHQNFSKIMRVTNKKTQNDKQGLFHGQELDWHCNGVLIEDPEECISLWCIESGLEGETYFADGVHAYNNLNDSIKEEIQFAELLLTNNLKKTYKKSAPYGTLLPHEQSDLDKIRTRSRYFTSKAEKNQITKKSSYIELKKSLVVRHPYSNRRGLYFPIYTVAQITGLKTPSRSKEIFNTICNSYVGPSGKFYKHIWQKGDLILSDQVHSLHRRNPYSGVRELYRTAFWYHGLENIQKVDHIHKI